MFEHIHLCTQNIDISKSEIANYIRENANPIVNSSLQACLGNPDFSRLQGIVKELEAIPGNGTRNPDEAYIQTFSYMNFNSLYLTRRRNYASFLLHFTYSGHGKLIYDGNTYDLYSGDLFFIDCIKPHEYYNIGNEWEHSDLHIYGGRTTEIYTKYFSGISPVFHIPQTDQYQELLENLLKAQTEYTFYHDFEVSNRIERIILLLLNLAAKENTPLQIPDYIKYLRRYMENNFSSDLSLEQLSDFANMSKYHLSHEFKRYTGFSPHNYLITLRINKACNLLLSTSMPTNEIGALAGIPNETNFLRLFKKYTGTTPSEYRRRHLFN